MKREEISLAADICVIAMVGIVIISMLISHILWVLIPFLLAYILASVMHIPAAAVAKKTGIGIGTVSTVFTCLGVAVICVLGWRILLYAADIANELWRVLREMIDDRSGFFEGVGDGVLTRVLSEARSVILSMAKEIALSLARIACGVPRVTVAAVVTVAASVMICARKNEVDRWLISHLPRQLTNRIKFTNNIISDILAVYFRTYFYVFLLTFCEFLLFFVVIGQRKFLQLSLIIAIIDILPILGAGTVVIPWGLFLLAFGNIKKGMILLIFYAFITVLRRIYEPLLLFREQRSDPLAMLLWMYVGYELTGVFGMLIMPFVAITVSRIILSKGNEISH